VTVRTLFSGFRSLRHKASVDISGLHLNNPGAPRLLKTPENNEKLRRFFFLDLYNLRITTTCSIVGFKKQFFSSPLSCWKKKNEKKLKDKEARRFVSLNITFNSSFQEYLLGFYIF